MNSADKQQFLKLIISKQVLCFGAFTLKSGRVSPYFFNAGLFNTGALIAELAGFYAKCIAANISGDFVLYGPAYKGIPLAAASAVQLYRQQGRDVPYCFNRKEAKAHGEGGQIVGAELKGEVVIIDDVITAGTAIRESAAIITAAGANIKAIVVALDRQERAAGADLSAVQAVSQQYAVPIYSLIGLDDIVRYAAEHAGRDESLAANAEAIRAYQQRYGVLS